MDEPRPPRKREERLLKANCGRWAPRLKMTLELVRGGQVPGSMRSKILNFTKFNILSKLFRGSVRSNRA
jgi:hypothetical protein